MSAKHILTPLTKLFLATVLCGLAVQACRQDKETSAQQISDSDSTSLRIALLPMEECSVLVRAKQSGLADSMGVNVDVVMFDAVMDIDTAILSGTAHVYFSDSLRICRIAEDSLRPTLLLPIPVKLSLIANAKKQIDSIPDLGTHMVGMTRWSLVEEWLAGLADTTTTMRNDIYHAQINSIPLRFTMLRDGLLDAAILPRPWSDSLMAGHHRLLCDTTLCGMGLYISRAAMRDSALYNSALNLRRLYAESIKNQN